MAQAAAAIVYVKEHCPFCVKVRLFLLEAGLVDQVQVDQFLPGTPQEAIIRSAVESASAKASFPTLTLADGQWIADSDAIVAHVAEVAGINTANYPFYIEYTQSILPNLLALFKENRTLKQRFLPDNK